MVRFATVKDVEALVEMRILLLKGVVSNPEEVKWEGYSQRLNCYYRGAIENRDVIGCLFEEDGVIKSMAVMNLYRVTPSPTNPLGKMALLSDMYTRECYRGQGIGKQVLKGIMDETQRRGHNKVILNATESGGILYRKYGFRHIDGEMSFKF